MYGAVDIGGTKTLVAVFNEHGKIIEEKRFPTPKDYEEFKIELAKVVAELSTADFSRVVVAAPGLLNRKAGVGIAFTNLPWRSVHIQRDCEHIFKAPVRIENDTKLAGLAEAQEFPKIHQVLYLTISTGIGGALIIDSQLDPDFEDIEVGDMIIEHKGKYVHWQTIASGKAIVAKYGKRADEIDDPAIWQVISKDIAVGVISLVASLTPDVIIMGGGVGAHLEKFKKFLEADLDAFKTPLLTIPPIYKAKHPEEAVIYGCYEFAKSYEKVTA